MKNLFTLLFITLTLGLSAQIQIELPQCETVTTLVDDGNGTITYTSEDGTVTTFDANNILAYDNVNHELDFTNLDGTVTTLDLNVASLALNGNDLEYTREDGTVQTITLPIATPSTLVDNNANANVQVIATHTSGTGIVEEIEETVTNVTNLQAGNLIGIYTSEDGTTYDIDETITTFASTQVINQGVNNDSLITYTHTYVNEDGSNAVITYQICNSRFINRSNGRDYLHG